MAFRDLLYGAYGRRLEKSLDSAALPRHVGIMVDGNRRWAKAFGETSAHGHRAGADRVVEFMGWCADEGIEVVTLYLLSTDNLRRPAEELAPLIEIVEDCVARVAAARRWRVHPVGALDLLPAETAGRLRRLQEETADIRTGLVNVAIGYGGRQEIADAVRSLLREHAARGTSMEELADVVTVDHIADHLYTKGQPDPDLVIRTSGEQRLSGFLLWQSAHSEFYFCEVLWPDFRKVDFLRALRSYAARERRYGA
ncbi:isoprenyl transferase [Kineococcus gynurae]|uniref:Isoprenyl transferase n=1 Tax=Kineococcus gynurae TaxID=452979 RepID=A0ABV5LNI9_9ACTN